MSSITKFYLVAFNVISLYGWAYCLNLAVPALVAGQLDNAWLLSGETVKWVQTLALLEVRYRLALAGSGYIWNMDFMGHGGQLKSDGRELS